MDGFDIPHDQPLLDNMGAGQIMNPGETHVICVVLADISGSMAGEKEKNLREGLQLLGDELNADEIARGCVEIRVIPFNTDVDVSDEFMPVPNYQVPSFTCEGTTAMYTAVEKGLDAIAARKAYLRAQNIQLKRPWMVLMTDGLPTDSDPAYGGDPMLAERVRKRVLDAQNEKHCTFFPFLIGNDQKAGEVLGSLTPNHTYFKVTKENIKNIFQFLSDSLKVGSKRVITEADTVSMEEIQQVQISPLQLF